MNEPPRASIGGESELTELPADKWMTDLQQRNTASLSHGRDTKTCLAWSSCVPSNSAGATTGNGSADKPEVTNGLRGRPSSRRFEFGENYIATRTLNHGGDRQAVISPHDQIALPIPRNQPVLDFRRAEVGTQL